MSSAVLFTVVANVSSIPGSPSNNDYIEIGNSTGIQSFSPLSGLPNGFVGASGLTVRLRYDSGNSTWVYMSYFANDSETRYVTIGNPNPVYYANQSAFPSASTYHGGVAHSHADGAMYYAHGGSWVKLLDANDTFDSPIAALANLPASPSNEDRVEVTNSTGVESSSAVSGVPSGFVGATTLSVRLQYNSSTSKWVYQRYFANDSDERYATNYLPVIKGDGTSSGQVGKITLNCSNNNHGVSIQSPPHSAAATYTLTLPNNAGTSGQALKTDGSGNLSFADVTSSIITQDDFAYTPASNTITFDKPGDHQTDPFGYVFSSANGVFGFSTRNATLLAAMQGLSVGDAVTIEYTHVNGTVVTQSNTVATAVPSNVGNSANVEIIFSVAMVYVSSATSQVKLTSTHISNGVLAPTNNQVLRYKTATQKWTVDSIDSIDAAFIETPQAIATSKVIAANTNAGIMGPTVSLNSGVTITVGSNSILTVLS